MDMSKFFQRLVDCFIAGNLDAVASHYLHPLIVYRPNGISIEKTPEDTIKALADRLISVQSGGASFIRTRIDQTGDLQNDRQPFDVTWTFYNRQGHQVGQSQLRYFCRQIDGKVRIELIDILQTYRQEPVPVATAVNQ